MPPFLSPPPPLPSSRVYPHKLLMQGNPELRRNAAHSSSRQKKTEMLGSVLLGFIGRLSLRWTGQEADVL